MGCETHCRGRMRCSLIPEFMGTFKRNGVLVRKQLHDTRVEHESSLANLDRKVSSWVKVSQRTASATTVQPLSVQRKANGQTGLMLAVHAAPQAAVKTLIAHRANLNITAKFGLSALMLAVVAAHRRETSRPLPALTSGGG